MKRHQKHICILAFIIVAYILLPVMNADYLYTIQDNGVFISGHTFMMDTVRHEGGWTAWAARYLTQFFYHPWLGSTILILFWVAIYWITIQMFRISNKWSPLALIIPAILLYHLLDYGYWIYYAKLPGLPFQPTIMVLLCLLFTWGVILLTRKLNISWNKKGLIAVSLLGAILYVGNMLWPSSPWHYNYSFRHSILTTLTDRNFKHELRMYRALDEGRFDAVLEEMPKDGEKPPTNLMVMYKNIALMHTGRLTDLFKTNNCGTHPDMGKTLNLHISQLGAPLIYYQFGQFNYAYRWAMENSVEYGLSFRNLKMMAQCAIWNSDIDVAVKYLTLLKSSTFHRKWAKEHEAWVYDHNTFMRSQDYQNLSQLMQDEDNVLDNDNSLCEKYLLDHFSDLLTPNNPKLEEVIMCLSLWTEDTYSFSLHFYNYVHRHPGEAIPELYQQGAILLCNTEQSPVQLDNFPFDQQVASRYNRFVQDYNSLSSQNMDDKEMAERLRPLYGDTFWWYHYFYTDFQIY